MEIGGDCDLLQTNIFIINGILMFALTGEIVLTASEVLNNDGSPGIVIR